MNQTLTALIEPQTSDLETFLEERHKQLAPVATTRTPSGAIIDWVPRDAQLGGALSNQLYSSQHRARQRAGDFEHRRTDQ